MAKPEPKEASAKAPHRAPVACGANLRTALPASVLMLPSLPAPAQPAPNARPTGGTVVAGSASISRTPANTQINQSSPRAAIDWQSFDVGSQQSVTFAQPSASAVALNRVTGPDPSQIAGRIDANGQIILVNQSGVTFYKGAQVNAAGVMVSAANISNQNFMAGQAGVRPGRPQSERADRQPRQHHRAARRDWPRWWRRRWRIRGRSPRGWAMWCWRGRRPRRWTCMATGCCRWTSSNQVTQAPVGKDGKAATALVTNTGVIVADGGTVQLTARAADGIWCRRWCRRAGRSSAASVGGTDRDGGAERRRRLGSGGGAAVCAGQCAGHHGRRGAGGGGTTT